MCWISLTSIGDSVNFVKLNLSWDGRVGGFKRFYNGKGRGEGMLVCALVGAYRLTAFGLQVRYYPHREVAEREA